MNELIKIFESNGNIVTTSRSVAEIFSKEHYNILRDIQTLLAENSKLSSLIIATSYSVNGQHKQYPEYLLTRDGFTILAMGFTGSKAMEFKLKYIEAFNKMESELRTRHAALPDFSDPVAAARAWADEKEARINAENQIEADKPKILFADAVSISDTDILIGDLAKILRQNGILVGQNRLFKILREQGYLMSAGLSYNIPSQRCVNSGWMRIIERTVQDSKGKPRIVKTPMVTGKGQQYFINKFLNEKEPQYSNSCEIIHI